MQKREPDFWSGSKIEFSELYYLRTIAFASQHPLSPHLQDQDHMKVREDVSIATTPRQSLALPSDEATLVRATNPYRVRNETTGSNVCGSMITPEEVRGTYGQ